MPIRSLESYLFERKLVNSSSIEILQNATIGIDVEHYLSRIYTYKKEQFLSGIGGIPSSIKDYIKSDLLVFKEFNIKPIFVIPGLKIQLQCQALKTNELSSHEQHLESTWNKLNSKNSFGGNSGAFNNMSYSESFRYLTDPLSISTMINDLIKIFIENDIDYLISPYDSSFQLSYLYQSKVIDMIYGSTDVLLTKVEKFILGMEFQSKDFRFVDKSKVLHELSLNERQFLDLSIMVGCSIQPTTFSNLPTLPKPNPIQPYPQLSYFKLALDIIFQYNNFHGTSHGDLYGFIQSLNDPKLTELYLKGLTAIKFIPILNQDGEIHLYSAAMAKLGILSSFDLLNDYELKLHIDKLQQLQYQQPSQGIKKITSESLQNFEKLRVPNDIHDIVSQRLPPELYFYQSIGLIPLNLLGAITRGLLDVRPPSEGGINDAYKKLITTPFYAKLLDSHFNLITQLLARYYQVKKIKVKYWFKDDILELNNRLTPPIFEQINHLITLKSESKEAFTLNDFFKSLEDDYVSNVSKKSFSKELIERNDIISTISLRSLYLYNIIDNKTHKLGSIGLILKTFTSENSSELKESYLQELVLLLLLISSKSIKLNESNKAYSSVPKHFKNFNNNETSLDQDELNKVTIISRIFSIHKFNIHPINYQGPISRSLLNFRSHLKFIQSNLINTLEVTLVDLIVRQEHNNLKVNYKNKEDWYKLIDELPFYKDINNTLLGVIAEIYFEFAAKQKKSNVTISKDELIKVTQDHILNNVFQINNVSYNINVNGMNSIDLSQFLDDMKQGLELWSLFIKLCKTTNEIDNNLISDSFLKEILETDEWLNQFVNKI